MNIVFDIDEDQQIEQVAERLSLTIKEVKDKLKNIYMANLSDDLGWISEMVEEDRENA